MSILRQIGAQLYKNGSCNFTVWAPEAEKIILEIIQPQSESIPMAKKDYGYWEVTLERIASETRYFYRINDSLLRPDPASALQPEGVHTASAVYDQHAFNWSDKDWPGLPLGEYIIYELHTGTFTPQGTFEGIIKQLDHLLTLGITAIEIMPVAQFPGQRNWGYDGVYPYAVQNSYGGPDGLKKLVNACHEKGLAVILDVVYNHLGPEGNYLRDFGPYFTDKYKTPWGSALNFDDSYADGVRNYFIQNALMWFRDFHIDALRLDAVHAIIDLSARHFLEELSETVALLSKKFGRKFLLIAESDLNDVKLINGKEKGGYGLHAQWNDDFHHALHTLLTGENQGYYADFGKVADLEKALRHTFVFNGNYAPHRQKSFGSNADQNPGIQFIVCAQNHDQVGNRMLGDRLTKTLPLPALKLAAATYILSPYIPMLFMGEEYGEKNPFQYFISHTDKELIEAVREGRKEEFKAFNWNGEIPDPQSYETFKNALLTWQFQDEEALKIFNFYCQLIALRKTHQVFCCSDKAQLETEADEPRKILKVLRWAANKKVLAYYNFGKENQVIYPDKQDEWQVLLTNFEPENTIETGRKITEKITLSPFEFLMLESTNSGKNILQDQASSPEIELLILK